MRVFTMSIGWMQQVAKQPAIEPVRNGLAACHAGEYIVSEAAMSVAAMIARVSKDLGEQAAKGGQVARESLRLRST